MSEDLFFMTMIWRRRTCSGGVGSATQGSRTTRSGGVGRGVQRGLGAGARYSTYEGVRRRVSIREKGCGEGAQQQPSALALRRRASVQAADQEGGGRRGEGGNGSGDGNGDGDGGE